MKADNFYINPAKYAKLKRKLSLIDKQKNRLKNILKFINSKK